MNLAETYLKAYFDGGFYKEVKIELFNDATVIKQTYPVNIEGVPDWFISLDFFPEVILESTLKLQTHNITQYAIELAKDFQIFYENCRVISENKELTQARIKLVLACRIVLKNTLDIMGVSTPERM